MRVRTLAKGARAVALMLLAVPLIATPWGNPPASAGEASGDLDLQIRLLNVDRGNGSGREMNGAARIEALLVVAQATEKIRLTVEKADGSNWMVGSHPFNPQPVSWRKPDGSEPQEAADGLPSVGPREALRTSVVVPLRGADVHEIILRVTAYTASGPITTEAMLRAPLGVQEELPVEQDGVATIKMKE
jgi:hypothetical protein